MDTNSYPSKAEMSQSILHWGQAKGSDWGNLCPSGQQGAILHHNGNKIQYPVHTEGCHKCIRLGHFASLLGVLLGMQKIGEDAPGKTMCERRLRDALNFLRPSFNNRSNAVRNGVVSTSYQHGIWLRSKAFETNPGWAVISYSKASRVHGLGCQDPVFEGLEIDLEIRISPNFMVRENMTSRSWHFERGTDISHETLRIHPETDGMRRGPFNSRGHASMLAYDFDCGNTDRQKEHTPIGSESSDGRSKLEDMGLCSMVFNYGKGGVVRFRMMAHCIMEREIFRLKRAEDTTGYAFACETLGGALVFTRGSVNVNKARGEEATSINTIGGTKKQQDAILIHGGGDYIIMIISADLVMIRAIDC
ncbi:hypothetical protein Tco_0991303 [Tanacetum coccineum]|uniref:Uncharacterized protein n=1 Tax=Tanacetum coccineum TaxID=301880 RepID=A0ABQ5EZ77_9ASTR